VFKNQEGEFRVVDSKEKFGIANVKK